MGRPSFLVFTTLLGILLTANKITHAGCPALPGDVDANGTVDVVDVQCETLLALSELSSANAPSCLQVPLIEADLNCDGSANVVDIQLLINLALKKRLSAAVDANVNGCVDTCEAKPSDPNIYNPSQGYIILWPQDSSLTWCDIALHLAGYPYAKPPIPLDSGSLGVAVQHVPDTPSLLAMLPINGIVLAVNETLSKCVNNEPIPLALVEAIQDPTQVAIWWHSWKPVGEGVPETATFEAKTLEAPPYFVLGFRIMKEDPEKVCYILDTETVLNNSTLTAYTDWYTKTVQACLSL